LIILIAAGLLLAGGVAAFIVLPLVRSSPGELVGGPGPAEELFARRDRVYGELRDLEFDVRVGKVTVEDYRDARDRLELEAARVLRAIDTQVKAIDEEIEREVQQLREQRHACPACGASIESSARFCAACGAPLPAASPR